jgi:hypothetical protein
VQVSLIDLKSFTITDTWKISKYRANFPMTLDTANNHVMIGFRPRLYWLLMMVSRVMKLIRELVGDVDDVFFNGNKQQIIASGGDGYINLFEKGADNSVKLVSNIGTRSGARASLLIPSLGYYVLAERAEGGKSAALAIYKINGSN